MLAPLFLMLPIVALIALLIMGKVFWGSRRGRWMVGGSVLAAVTAGVVNLWAIFHSTSSTAAIGVIFVPLLMAIAAPAGAMLGLMAHEARFHARSMWGLLSFAGLAATVAAGGHAAWRIAEFRSMQQETDAAVLARAIPRKLSERDYFVLAAIAANRRTPAPALLQIAEYPDAELHEKRNGWINSYDKDQLAVVRKVIRNPNAPLEALEKLAESKNEYVRGDVAQEQRTPVELLRRLASSPHGYLVDWGLAWNRSTPVEILERLPYEKDAVVAQNLAHNPSTPAALLERLARHEGAVVRGGVAGNSSAPEHVLRSLTGDREQWVAQQAERQLKRRR